MTRHKFRVIGLLVAEALLIYGGIILAVYIRVGLVGMEFELDSKTGQLTWDSPIREGAYNIAIRIEEFRNGISVGYVIRDMQIYIATCSNRPPVVTNQSPACIIAGQTLTRFVTATDPDTQNLIMLTRRKLTS